MSRRAAQGYLWRIPLALAVVGGVMLLRSSVGAQDLEQLHRQRLQREQMVQEKSQIQEKLAYFKTAQQELELEVRNLRGMVNASKTRRQGLEDRVRSITADKTRQEDLLSKRQGQMRVRKARINDRLRRMYRLEKQSRTATLFQTVRFLAFARDAHLLSLLQSQDRQALDEYQALAEDVARKSRALAETLTQLTALREELEQEERSLADREKFLQVSIQDQSRNQTLYQKYLVDLERMIEGMDREIAQLETRAPTNSVAPAIAPGAIQGALPLPAKGTLVAGFGEQDPRYDLKKFQRGIVLRVAEKAPVSAVTGGTVVHAGPFRGYQNLVVLDHGGGLFTVYGHMEDLKVERGQILAAGAVLGHAALPAPEGGYDLYFEIRYQGTPEDPAKWLRPNSLQR
ncbi:MAG: peptidoglycan DD-metalloendopeptidase family protein [Deltaproteobacteria bacterium]|nr:peptidoglycan DD-metalloendopeptidase family protein [Deltaproteobacteria bacterium]